MIVFAIEENNMSRFRDYGTKNDAIWAGAERVANFPCCLLSKNQWPHPEIPNFSFLRGQSIV